MRIRIVLLLLAVPVVILSQTPTAKQESEMLAKVKELYGDRAPKTITFVTISRPGGSAGRGGSGGGSAAAGATTGSAGSGSAGASSGGSKTQPARFNAPGDTATGAVLQEEGDQAFVDASPCDGRVMVFTQPYTKSATSPTTCGDKQVARYRFVQQ